ncbi:MAG: hypothetical protein ACJ8C4_15580 [Gemmataceae bacterium]
MITERAAYASRTSAQRQVKADSWLDDAVVDQEFLDRRLGELETKQT